MQALGTVFFSNKLSVFRRSFIAVEFPVEVLLLL